MSLARAEVNNRRLHHRYPVDLPLEFQASLGTGVLITGVARIVDLSNGGLLFESTSHLPVGLTIQVSFEWPQRSSTAIALTLHGTGMTVRNQGNYTAVKVQEYEFRTAQKAIRERAVGCDSQYVLVSDNRPLESGS